MWVSEKAPKPPTASCYSKLVAGVVTSRGTEGDYTAFCEKSADVAFHTRIAKMSPALDDVPHRAIAQRASVAHDPARRGSGSVWPGCLTWRWFGGKCRIFAREMLNGPTQLLPRRLINIKINKLPPSIVLSE